MRPLAIIALVAVLMTATGCASMVEGIMDDVADRKADAAVEAARQTLADLGVRPANESVLFDRNARMDARLEEAVGLVQYMVLRPEFTLAQATDVAMRLLTMFTLEYYPQSTD